MDITANEIKTAYEVLCIAKLAFYKANETEIVAAQVLKDAQLAAIRLNTVTGTNEKAREASLVALTADEIAVLREAEAASRLAKRYLEIAALDVEELRLRMRLLEYEIRAGQDEAELSDLH